MNIVTEAERNLGIAVAGKQALLRDPKTTAKQLAEANALLELCEVRLADARQAQREQDEADQVAEERRQQELRHAATVARGRAVQAKARNLPKLAADVETTAAPFVKALGKFLGVVNEVRDVVPSDWQSTNRPWPTPLEEIRMTLRGDPVANFIGQVQARAAREAGVFIPGLPAYDPKAPTLSALMRQVSASSSWIYDVVVNGTLPAPDPPPAPPEPVVWRPRRWNPDPIMAMGYRNRKGHPDPRDVWMAQDNEPRTKEVLIEQFGWKFDHFGEVVSWPDVRKKSASAPAPAVDNPASFAMANNIAPQRPAMAEEAAAATNTAEPEQATPRAPQRPYTGPEIDAVYEQAFESYRRIGPTELRPERPTHKSAARAWDEVFSAPTLEQAQAAARAELLAAADGAGATMPGGAPATGSEGSGSPAAPAPTDTSDLGDLT